MGRHSGERRTEALVQQATEIGENNKRILALAKAFCRNIDLDRSHMGVGEVELMTGLPVSGGGFRCDHARGSSMHGMDLEHLAFAFYKQHCRVCVHRAPTNALSNLGTWAESRIREAEKSATEAALQKADAERASQERAAHRHLIAGSADAVEQSVLLLLDRIDSPDGDREAASDLLAMADLHPDAFSDDLLSMMMTEAIVYRRGAFIEAVLRVHERVARASQGDLIGPVMGCLSVGIGVNACCRFVANAATVQDLESSRSAFTHMVALAGINEDGPFHRAESEPAALLRAFELMPKRAEEWLREELLNGDNYRMANACRAAKAVVEKYPSSGLALLPALVTAARRAAFDISDEYWESPRGAATQALGLVVVHFPDEVEQAAESVWSECTADERYALVDAYRRAVGAAERASEDPSSAFVTACARRGLNWVLSESDPSTVQEAGSVLERVCRRWPHLVAVPLEAMFGGVAILAGNLDTTPPGSSPMDQLEQMTRQQTLSVARRALRSAGVAHGVARPKDFWECLRHSWGAEGVSEDLRAQLTQMAGSLCKADETHLPSALPFMFSAMLGSSTILRAAGFQALADASRHKVELPDEVREAVIVGLQDQYLIVVTAAIEAASRLKFREDEVLKVMTLLLNFIAGYASDRMQASTVRTCYGCLLRLSESTEYSKQVKEILARACLEMPQYEAGKTLSWFISLEEAPSWPQAVVYALHPDDDPNYASLGDDQCDKLLERLATLPAQAISPYVDELLEIGKSRLPRDSHWAWQVAGCLSSCGQHVAAWRLSNDVYAGVPDTSEKRGLRLLASQIVMCFGVEAAIASGNDEAARAMEDSWEEAEVEAAAEEERTPDARATFF